MNTGTFRRYATPRFISLLLLASIFANVALGAATLSSAGHVPFAGHGSQQASAVALATSAVSGHEESLERSVPSTPVQADTRVLTSAAAPAAISYGDPGHESSFEKATK